MLEPISNFSLYPFNTFGMRAQAQWFDVLRTEEEVEQISHHPLFSYGILILGGGSNILFTQDVPCWVLRNEIRGIKVVKETEQHIYVEVGAGEVWHSFVLYCVDKGYAGIENLSLIPGTVGASPIQNIGAYGVEVKDVITSVRFYHLEKKKFETYDNATCQFGYRDSIFKQSLKGKIIITAVTFQLNKKAEFHIQYGNIQQELEHSGITTQNLSIKAISDAVIRIRSSKLPDPKLIGNAGSFFKNPIVSQQQYEQLHSAYTTMPHYPLPNNQVKIPAAWLIEQCGWKGYRIGDAGVHEHQALVLVNYGGASGKTIDELSLKIVDSVQEKFNITLEREVQIL